MRPNVHIVVNQMLHVRPKNPMKQTMMELSVLPIHLAKYRRVEDIAKGSKHSRNALVVAVFASLKHKA